MEFCLNESCTNDEHWPGGCSAEKRRRLSADVGVQRATLRSRRAVSAETAATIIALGIDNNHPPVFPPSGMSGNHFTPCDKCSKPTRGARCFKCRTIGADR